MSNKTYLKNQIHLVSLNANDMFTKDEYEKYREIGGLINEINRLDANNTQDIQESQRIAFEKSELIAKKKQAIQQLTEMIKLHKGTPRKVLLDSVLYHKKDKPLPEGVTWWDLKVVKRIAEFESDMSRMMGVETNCWTFDKIVVHWKTEDLLEQLVTDGFVMDILEDGKIIQKKYRCFTASAGQLRRDKVLFVSEDMWAKIKDNIECGLDWDRLNKKGGVNVN